MNVPLSPHADEINLIEFVLTLWSEKLVLACFLIVAALVGGFVAVNSDAKYETSFEYHFGSVPPFRSENQVYQDLSKDFFDKEVFLEWKVLNPNSTLEFEMIEVMTVVDGFELEVADEEKAIILTNNKVLVKTADIKLVVAVSDYLKFVSSKISNNYQIQAKYRRSRLDRLAGGNPMVEFLAQELMIFDRTLALDEYFQKISEDKDLINIKKPRRPLNKSSSKLLIFIVSQIVGGIFGVVYVVVLNAFRKHKASKKQVAG